MDKVLVVSAHPDDETIGCGGTIFKHKKNGDEIHWLIITNVDIQHGWEEEFVSERQKEISKVSKLFRFKTCTKLNFPTTRLNEIPERIIIQKISETFKKIKPAVLYLPNKSDIHSDHQIAFKLAFSASKNFRTPYVKKILMYECLSETEFAIPASEAVFIPNYYSDISQFYNSKIKAMKIYASEVMDEPLPRSISTIEALARYRGSRIGCKYAEAFMQLLQIN